MLEYTEPFFRIHAVLGAINRLVGVVLLDYAFLQCPPGRKAQHQGDAFLYYLTWLGGSGGVRFSHASSNQTLACVLFNSHKPNPFGLLTQLSFDAISQQATKSQSTFKLFLLYFRINLYKWVGAPNVFNQGSHNQQHITQVLLKQRRPSKRSRLPKYFHQ